MFKLKLHVNNSFNKFKIKFIIKEFSQMHDVNYKNMFVLHFYNVNRDEKL